MSHSPEFGRRLKALRQVQGLTQDVLAERVGCATETIRKLESGRRRPSFQMAARIAEVLGLESEAYTSWMRAALDPSEGTELPRVTEAATSAARSPALPTYLTPFMGREREQAILTTLLGQPSYRLITLLGPGGVGKTRLAVEAARTAQDRFRDGVYFVPLAALESSEHLVSTIASHLGIEVAGQDEPMAQLLRSLGDKELLLALDNFEHLLGGVELIQELLQAAPGVTVLATSRERLNLSGEVVHTLGGLVYPEAGSVAPVAHYPAVQLLLECVQRVQRAFCAGQEELKHAARICRLVQGMPLAIVLAAGWVEVLSLEEVANEIEASLDFLATEMRDVPERQRSIRAAFEYSWKRLAASEQYSLMKLAVFRGGFTREAAAHVAGADLATLRRVANKSLVAADDRGRYQIHELLRQYAFDKLAEAKEDERIRTRHLTYFVGVVEALRPHWTYSRWNKHVLEQLEAEIDNLRAALRHSWTAGSWTWR